MTPPAEKKTLHQQQEDLAAITTRAVAGEVLSHRRVGGTGRWPRPQPPALQPLRHRTSPRGTLQETGLGRGSGFRQGTEHHKLFEAGRGISGFRQSLPLRVRAAPTFPASSKFEPFSRLTVFDPLLSIYIFLSPFILLPASSALGFCCWF